MNVWLFVIASVVACGGGPTRHVDVPAPAPAPAFEAAAPLGVVRLDCGGPNEPMDISIFSDVHAFDGMKRALTGSCYLVKHGADYLLWDSGIVAGARDEAGKPYVKTRLVDQLATLGVRPADIKYLAISHRHGDHTGQAVDFPGATLLIGAEDWTALAKSTDEDQNPVAPWLGDAAGKVEQVTGDKDVFGDGSVVMLATPGHTRGHHCLLVRLRETGAIILSGDLAVFREAYDHEAVPSFAEDRAASLASFARIKQLAANLRATVVIQHDPRDVAKLPAFPAAAR